MSWADTGFDTVIFGTQAWKWLAGVGTLVAATVLGAIVAAVGKRRTKKAEGSTGWRTSSPCPVWTRDPRSASGLV